MAIVIGRINWTIRCVCYNMKANWLFTMHGDKKKFKKKK